MIIVWNLHFYIRPYSDFQFQVGFRILHLTLLRSYFAQHMLAFGDVWPDEYPGRAAAWCPSNDIILFTAPPFLCFYEEVFLTSFLNHKTFLNSVKKWCRYSYFNKTTGFSFNRGYWNRVIWCGHVPEWQPSSPGLTQLDVLLSVQTNSNAMRTMHSRRIVSLGRVKHKKGQKRGGSDEKSAETLNPSWEFTSRRLGSE